ncbi:hypothetical protein Gasu2_61770 [Galdieria sulphuraria]|uniref:L-seryl-tRNA(Sec) kinase n=1 Tax=Galdieria sulphuraria TaxID=130081 RepID=M2XWY6_GALSU|nr:uncharacterized protein Gasu_43110 [Galdieria sulphuraria]EME28143.1 hypothetical protein Gasu_43110 [Galdieria sulphuraria]GJD12067.1 hypothetical protein Gasu2_61770 [Galdieria sulphuraria]|eukprot:XP_005704663.1 hypothetical protein Gasu_43110 [Galdieria sulphuraria]
MTYNCRNSTVVVLCGAPGAGKTTFCKTFCESLVPQIFCSTAKKFYRLCESASAVHFCVLHVEYDFVYRQHADRTCKHGFNADLWKKGYLVVEEIVKFLLSDRSEVCLSQSLRKKETGWFLEYSSINFVETLTIPLYTNCLEYSDIISDSVHWFILLDDNFMYDSMRRRVFNLCRVCRVHFLIFYLTLHPANCLERLSLRDDSPPLQVVKSTLERFESPKRVGSMGKHIVTLNGSYELEDGALSWYDLFQFILSDYFLSFPLPPTSETKAPNLSSTSEKHQFDLLLRKAISNIIRRHDHIQNQQEHWKRLCNIRKQMIKEYERKWKPIVSDSTVEYWETILSSRNE